MVELSSGSKQQLFARVTVSPLSSQKCVETGDSFVEEKLYFTPRVCGGGYLYPFLNGPHTHPTDYT